jgi:hypothetical protein
MFKFKRYNLTMYTTVREGDTGFEYIAVTVGGYLATTGIAETAAQAEYEISEQLKMDLNNIPSSPDYKIIRVDKDNVEMWKAINLYWKYQDPGWKQLRSIEEWVCTLGYKANKWILLVTEFPKWVWSWVRYYMG